MGFIKRIGRGILAALTSPTVVKQERSLAAMIAVRLVVSAGGTAMMADIVYRLIHG